MSKSLLFSYLSYLNQQRARLKPPVIRCVQKTDSQGDKFCCLELAINPDIHFIVNNQPVWLQEAHFTIYERQRAACGAYHFTVTIINQQGVPQKVRIYFDEEGKVLRKPHFFTHDLGIKEFELADNKRHHDLNEGLLGLSARLSETVVQPFMRNMFKHINQLEEQYRAADSSANKTDLLWSQQPTEENRITYEQALKQMITILQSLISLTDHSLHRGRLRFVNAKLDYLNKPEVTQTPTQSLPDTASSTTEMSEASSTTTAIVKTLVATPRSLDDDVKRIQEKLSQFSKITHADDAEYVTQFTSLAQAFFELQLYVGEAGYAIGTDALQIMGKLEKSILKTGKELAKKLALSKASSLLEKLPATFRSALSDNDLLNKALENEDHELLACLLRYSQCPIETQSVQIQGKRYPSALHYCLESSKNQNLLLAIVALRPLSWWTDESLLLAAHRVLSNKQSPIKLEYILTSTMQPYQLVSFYNRLIRALENNLKNSAMTEEGQRLLRTQLQDYRKKLICARYADPFKRNADLFSPAALQRSEEKALAATSPTLSNYLEKLQQDPDVLVKKEALRSTLPALINQGVQAVRAAKALSPSNTGRREQSRLRLSSQAQLKKVLSSFLDYTDQIVKLYANVPSLDEYQPPTYDELKSRLLTFLGDLFGHMHDINELIADSRSYLQYMKKTQETSDTQMDELDRRRDEIQDNIDAFDETYGFIKTLTQEEREERERQKVERQARQESRDIRDNVRLMEEAFLAEASSTANSGGINLSNLRGLASLMRNVANVSPVDAPGASARPHIERPKP